MEISEFIAKLAEELKLVYTPKKVGGGHDTTHVLRMIELGQKIKEHLDFDWSEYVIACWLHNVDRCFAFKEKIAQTDLRAVLVDLLAEAPLDEEAVSRIVIAAATHWKKDDEPGDSTLLAALRVADKLDRLNLLGIIACAAHRGQEKLMYNPELPFGYTDTSEKALNSVYNDWFRVLEWYGMLPYDWARDLANAGTANYVFFMRIIGQEIAASTDCENKIEDDIKKALGPHYPQFAI